MTIYTALLILLLIAIIMRTLLIILHIIRLIPITLNAQKELRDLIQFLKTKNLTLLVIALHSKECGRNILLTISG